MIWLGERAGYLSDWSTQFWVRQTGRRVNLTTHAWLEGPVGPTTGIGTDFFLQYARGRDLQVVQCGQRGLLQDFEPLAKSCVGSSQIPAAIKSFYEETSEYDLDAWSEWRGGFRLFGVALAKLFSRRLQQLNVPLSSLDSSKGMTSDVLQLRDGGSGQVVQTAWIRRLHATGNVLYAGAYSLCEIPGVAGFCVKVVFPLPNGNAIVIMKPETHVDGSFAVTSAGRSFGDAGFYFTVAAGPKEVWARYVRSLKETIKIYSAEPGTVRADHHLWIWGRQFLQLHYRMRRRTSA